LGVGGLGGGPPPPPPNPQPPNPNPQSPDYFNLKNLIIIKYNNKMINI